MSEKINVAEMLRPPAKTELVVGTTCPLFIGTCGYSYTEWSDCGFYPADTRTADMLGLYRCFFPVVELNYTWYQMPRADAITRMAAKTPVGFGYAAKLTRTITHERRDDWQEQLRLYRKGIEPLGKSLVAVLVQLPPDFEWDQVNRYYLAKLLDGLHGLPVAVEFRHVSWATDSVFSELEKRKVTLVAVDEPALPGLFPALDIVTNPEFFYVRFHGRNRTGWKSTNMQKKFDYDYSSDELRQWAQGNIRTMSRSSAKGMIFFNNHVRAQAPKNARSLQQILKDCN